MRQFEYLTRGTGQGPHGYASPARCRRLPDCLPGEHPPHEGRWHRHGRFRPDALCRRGLFRRETGCRQDSLYYATTSYTVLPYSGDEEANQTKTIEFASSHYDLSVEVAGVPAPGTRAGSLPVLEICGVSPCTDFENRACGEATDYLLETEYEAGKALLTARTNIMRHKNHENVNIRLSAAPNGEPLAEVNLARFLADNPIIDCSKHEVLIPIRIEFKSGEITVSVPEWYIEQVKPEF